MTKPKVHFKAIALATILGPLLSMTGCSDTDKTQSESVSGSRFAIIGGIASDFSSSEISIANAEAPYEVIEGYASQTLSDISVATFGEKFYRIGRFQQDNLTRFDFNTPSLVDWQFTTDDTNSAAPSNPYDIIFVNENKAYIIRYGSASILIVNPSVAANNEANFRIGEIDLSAYDVNGVPEMSAAVYSNNRLYVVMQAMDASFAPGEASLAVIDTTTDTEINIGGGTPNGMTLQIKNPIDLKLYGTSLYIAGAGRYERFWIPAPAEMTGGIEKISIVDFSTELLVDDGIDPNSLYGNIDALAIVSDSLAYFRGAQSTGSSQSLAKLYQFNPTTGQVNANPLLEFDDIDIQDIEISPEGLLWVGVGDPNDPEIRIVDPANNTATSTIDLSANPAYIVFSEAIQLD